jgi:hypothetical protein
LRGVNGNSIGSRRYREVAMALADELGGPDKLTEASKIFVRQVAGLTVRVEALQAKVVAGEDVDLEQLVRLSNVLGRTFSRLGLKRQAPAQLESVAENIRRAFPAARLAADPS